MLLHTEVFCEKINISVKNKIPLWFLKRLFVLNFKVNFVVYFHPVPAISSTKTHCYCAVPKWCAYHTQIILFTFLNFTTFSKGRLCGNNMAQRNIINPRNCSSFTLWKWMTGSAWILMSWRQERYPWKSCANSLRKIARTSLSCKQ